LAGSNMAKGEHWSCSRCNQRVITHVQLKEPPTCSNKHKPTPMMPVK